MICATRYYHLRPSFGTPSFNLRFPRSCSLQFLPLIGSTLAVSPEKRPRLSSLYSSLAALRRQLLLPGEGRRVTYPKHTEALTMPAWQDLITSEIDTHRALPVGVVVGQRMGDGGNDGDIDDVSDSVESWSLAIACVEMVLDSKDKPIYENGGEKAKRYRWEGKSDHDDSNSSLRWVARSVVSPPTTLHYRHFPRPRSPAQHPRRP